MLYAICPGPKGQISETLLKGTDMVKVKTFATELKIFHTIKELGDLDEKVNQFIQENKIKRIISVSDTCTTDDKGATIGLIRVVAYE
jgi:hypothetical protein